MARPAVRQPDADRGLPAAWSALRPHPGQRAAFTSRARFVAIPAGRGSGKTELALRKLVMSLAIPKPHAAQYFYAGPTLAIAAQIAWSRLLALTPKQWLSGDPNHSLCKLTTVFGSSIQLFGLNQRDARVEGSQWDGGVIDESCYVMPGVFGTKVLPALTWRGGWCWRIGVPKRFGVGAAEYREWFQEGLSGKLPDRASFTWPSAEIVPPEMLEIAKTELDQKDYDEQMNASWVTAGGGVFHAFAEADHIRRCEYRADMPLVVACDFNVDPMAWTIGHRYRDRMEWIDEIFLRDAHTQAAVDVLWARYGDRHKGGFEFYGDAAGNQRKSSAAASITDWTIIHNDPRLKKAGREFYVSALNPAVADRFAACNALLRNQAGQTRMFIDPHCKMLIRDLRMRAYKPGSSEPEATVGSQIGHISDAMGYAVWRAFPVRLELDSSPAGVTIRGIKGAQHR